MYEEFFNLTENPFTITPNPRYLFLGKQHREALACLHYGLRCSGGFILLSGEVGTGKTTLCRSFLEKIPANVHVAFIFNPKLDERELLQAICDEFLIDYDKDGSLTALTDALNECLLEWHSKGQKALLLMDEAQNLQYRVLEQLRLLTNLETHEVKLLQVILVGQPELLDKLRQPELRQLMQRVVARYHLNPLSVGDLKNYISHRLKLAEGDDEIFSLQSRLRIAQLSHGIPRLVNLICDRALLGAFAMDEQRVTMKVVEQAANEVLGARKQRVEYITGRNASGKRKRLIGGATAALLVMMALGFWQEEVKSFVGTLAENWKSMPTTEASPATANDRLTRPEEMQNTGGSLPEHTTPPPSYLTLEDLRQAGHSSREAFGLLFKAWKLTIAADPAAPACDFAQRQGLDCWSRSDGDLKLLRTLNRPVVVKLRDERNELFSLALLQLDSSDAVLASPSGQVKMPANEFQKIWTGDFTVLWRRPPGFFKTLIPGDRGTTVDQILKRLSPIADIQSARDSHSFDATAVKLVRSIQRRCGLAVDGMVGKETIFAIDNLLGDVPYLSRRNNLSCQAKKVASLQ